ncbi:hypothetical protein K493DRAFT_295767 [Basidiobolus meristosporus CBS 931.73]|uniref:Protein PBN1 n=1 Tax=Basidiobolus meristosporus CBS 931.73 TaxID=1314790 RepID=A0A1Y1Z966_9FUNG|nr:hypothetical protein K493DRAFT_295767 [Basidiobolus meristosporus CBS 931.73]|eukprot:ORY06808.1 hypothetical protein K493DRAFT_295767 [Basidiobolus meristosporus CBS 931.73]
MGHSLWSLLLRFCMGIWFLCMHTEAGNGRIVKRADSESDSNNWQGFKVNYQIAWLDTRAGRFGGNITLALPTLAAPTPYWTVKFSFAQQGTKIEEYWGEWTMQRYKSGFYVILPVRESTSLVASYCFNGQFAVNDQLDVDSVTNLITPSSYTLIIKPSDGMEHEVPLLAQMDFTNAPLITDTPDVPFGPYIRASKPQFNPNAIIPDINDFGDGTTIQTTPVGLYIYGVVFLLGASIVGAGTYHRSQFRSEFRNQLYAQQKQDHTDTTTATTPHQIYAKS